MDNSESNPFALSEIHFHVTDDPFLENHRQQGTVSVQDIEGVDRLGQDDGHLRKQKAFFERYKSAFGRHPKDFILCADCASSWSFLCASVALSALWTTLVSILIFLVGSLHIPALSSQLKLYVCCTLSGLAAFYFFYSRASRWPVQYVVTQNRILVFNLGFSRRLFGRTFFASPSPQFALTQSTKIEQLPGRPRCLTALLSSDSVTSFGGRVVLSRPDSKQISSKSLEFSPESPALFIKAIETALRLQVERQNREREEAERLLVERKRQMSEAELSESRRCKQCQGFFTELENGLEACKYHPGVYRVAGTKITLEVGWSCCQKTKKEEPGCRVGMHVSASVPDLPPAGPSTSIIVSNMSRASSVLMGFKSPSSEQLETRAEGLSAKPDPLLGKQLEQMAGQFEHKSLFTVKDSHLILSSGPGVGVGIHDDLDQDLETGEPAQRKRQLQLQLQLAEDGLIRHIVTPSDTFSGLALRYGVSVDDLKRLNNISTSTVQIYQDMLLIPKK